MYRSECEASCCIKRAASLHNDLGNGFRDTTLHRGAKNDQMCLDGHHNDVGGPLGNAPFWERPCVVDAKACRCPAGRVRMPAFLVAVVKAPAGDLLVNFAMTRRKP